MRMTDSYRESTFSYYYYCYYYRVRANFIMRTLYMVSGAWPDRKEWKNIARFTYTHTHIHVQMVMSRKKLDRYYDIYLFIFRVCRSYTGMPERKTQQNGTVPPPAGKLFHENENKKIKKTDVFSS